MVRLNICGHLTVMLSKNSQLNGHRQNKTAIRERMLVIAIVNTIKQDKLLRRIRLVRETKS